jgi:hypothetical protein
MATTAGPEDARQSDWPPLSQICWATPCAAIGSTVSSGRAAAPLIGAVRTRTRAKRERSGSTEPSRHVMVRQACFGRPSASCPHRGRAPRRTRMLCLSGGRPFSRTRHRPAYTAIATGNLTRPIDLARPCFAGLPPSFPNSCITWAWEARRRALAANKKIKRSVVRCGLIFDFLRRFARHFETLSAILRANTKVRSDDSPRRCLSSAKIALNQRRHHDDQSSQDRDRNRYRQSPGESFAGPMNTVDVKAAVPTMTTEVRYRLHYTYTYQSYYYLAYPTYTYWGYPGYAWSYPGYYGYTYVW